MPIVMDFTIWLITLDTSTNSVKIVNDMDKIARIRAEIERRFLEYNHDSNHHIQAAECASILTFLDTLEEEPDKSLEEAAEEYADKHGFRVPYDGTDNFYDDADVKASKEGFIAGAKWQEKRDEEIIKTAEDHAFLAGADWQKEQDLAESAQSQSPLSVAYANRCFENGKQAMKEQLLKDAVDGVVEDWNPEPHPEITIPLNPEEFTAGDKVKLIIVKED